MELSFKVCLPLPASIKSSIEQLWLGKLYFLNIYMRCAHEVSALLIVCLTEAWKWSLSYEQRNHSEQLRRLMTVCLL